MAPQLPFSSLRLAELDGLRGIAILGVVVGHYLGEVPHGIRALTFGWLGVDLFFVLSGFLIGGILLDHQRASNYFSTFYIRRTCRIFPLYFAVIPAYLLFLHAFRPAHPTWIDEPLPALSYLTYTQNFVMAWHGKPDMTSLFPTWSLAVEEQFYMLLPLIIYFTPRARLPLVLTILILSANLLRIAYLFAPENRQLGTFVLLPCRWDMLFMGVVAAMVRRNPELWARATDREGRLLKILVLCGGWILVPIALFSRYAGHSWMHIIGLPVVSVCFSAYLLLVISRESEGRTMRRPTLRFFGGISYGLYLIHQPIALILHGFLLDKPPDIGTGAQWLVTLLATAVSIGLAWVSFKFFETPFVKLGHRWRYDAAPESVPPEALKESPPNGR